MAKIIVNPTQERDNQSHPVFTLLFLSQAKSSSSSKSARSSSVPAVQRGQQQQQRGTFAVPKNPSAASTGTACISINLGQVNLEEIRADLSLLLSIHIHLSCVTCVCFTVWGGRLCTRFCNMFSGSSPCFLGQHGRCSSAQLPVELAETMLQNLFLNLPPQTVGFCYGFDVAAGS